MPEARMGTHRRGSGLCWGQLEQPREGLCHCFGPKVTSAPSGKRAGQHVLSSTPLPTAPDGDHMEPKVKVQQMNLIL